MLHSRLRPLSRRTRTPPPSIPTPNLQDTDTSPTDDEDAEDLFSSVLPHLFPDDAPSFHGDPGRHLLYASPRYGELDIMVPAYPSASEKRTEEVAAGMARADGGTNEVDEGRKLFAHFLWSAAMVVAEGVEDAEALPTRDDGMWKVTGERVLELGAG